MVGSQAVLALHDEGAERMIFDQPVQDLDASFLELCGCVHL
jgi:hypothetical protein